MGIRRGPLEEDAHRRKDPGPPGDQRGCVSGRGRLPRLARDPSLTGWIPSIRSAPEMNGRPRLVSPREHSSGVLGRPGSREPVPGLRTTVRSENDLDLTFAGYRGGKAGAP